MSNLPNVTWSRHHDDVGEKCIDEGHDGHGGGGDDHESQKPNTFRIAAFYAQKVSAQSAGIHFSRHIKKNA